MLVKTASSVAPNLRFWRRASLGCVVVMLLGVLSLAPYLTSSTELVRMRNAMLLMDGPGAGFDWRPDHMPSDFMQERGPADPLYAAAVAGLGLERLGSDWERVLAISRHILGGSPTLEGPPIQSDLRETYRRIRERGDGYCGDFTRVFMGMAIAAGMPVRAWAFSLDGFGGHGHIWPEIWNRQLGRWQLVDIYNNFYFHRADGVALSAAEFRKALLEEPLTMRRALLHPAARPGYEFEDKLWAYYRQGLAEWYMVWGNNVFSYDAAVVGRGLGKFSRSLEQLDAIAIGVHPRVNLLVDAGNRERVEAMRRLQRQLKIVAWVEALAAAALLACLVGWWLLARRSHAAGGGLGEKAPVDA